MKYFDTSSNVRKFFLRRLQTSTKTTVPKKSHPLFYRNTHKAGHLASAAAIALGQPFVMLLCRPQHQAALRQHRSPVRIWGL